MPIINLNKNIMSNKKKLLYRVQNFIWDTQILLRDNGGLTLEDQRIIINDILVLMGSGPDFNYKLANDYYVIGDVNHALAVSILGSDTHDFSPYTIKTAGFDLGAFDVAIAWTSPGG